METHAHHLHKAPSHGWKHYFFEFSMLFLAITLGFFVENQREHYADHQRAKKYAVNLYAEMKKDKADLIHLIVWTNAIVKKQDSFCLLAVEKRPNLTNGMLYYYAKSISALTTFSSNSSTMDELKSSGNLRIMDERVTFLLGQYFRTLSQMQLEIDLVKVEYEKMNGLALQIFDGYTLATTFSRENREFRDSCFTLNPPLASDDPRLMRQLIGLVKIESGYYREMTNLYLKGLHELAVTIIEKLKEEYHLKN